MIGDGRETLRGFPMNHILQCHDITKTDFVSGRNCRLTDAEGREFVDFESGCWSAALGYCHPRINGVMAAQIERVMHLGTRYPNALAEEAAVRVLDITGLGDGKCVLLSSGSEAVEFGVQAARRISGRPLLLTFSNSYLAAYGSGGNRRTDEWVSLDPSAGDGADPSAILDSIPFERIGGFIFEPGGSGSAAVRFPPAVLVREIARRVKAAGGLVVANEVTTGMGRTGRWFGFQHYDVRPDIVAVGKGLGNGYPVSAAAMRPEVADALERGGLHYAQSHQNDPLGAAVALEVIAIMQEERWVERGAELGAFFLGELRRLQEKHPAVKDARGRGMVLALEFRAGAAVTSATVFRALFERGFLVACSTATNHIRFDPSLTIEKDDVIALVSALDEILTARG
jgi:acetylornithine aminotransferase